MEEKMITKEDLMKACAEAMNEGLIDEMLKKIPMLAIAFAMYSAEISRRIFTEETEGEA